MLLYLVESSRTLCWKVYKRIGVVFKWFFPEVFLEGIISWISSVYARSVYWSVTKVACKVLAEAVYIQVWQRSSVITSLVCACREVLCGVYYFGLE